MKPFRATVVSYGGGEVRLLVDRDTMEYPPKGVKVVVLLLADLEEKK